MSSDPDAGAPVAGAVDDDAPAAAPTSAAATGTLTNPRRVRHRARVRSLRGLLMASPPLLLIAAFTGFPIVLAIAYSLGHTGGLNSTTALIAQHQHVKTEWWGTLGAYREVLTNERFQRDLRVTLLVTVVSTTVVLALALIIALYLRLAGGWAAKALTVVSVVPMFIPVVIASWAVLMFYAPDGFLRSLFAQVGLEGPTFGYTVTAIIIAQVWCSLPFAVLMCASGVQAVPDALIDAARDSGAGLVRTTFSVILPMAFVPIVIAATFTAIGIIGSFTVPYFTGPTAPTMLGVDMANYFTAYNRPQQSIVMAVVVFVAASLIAVTYVWANFRSSKESGA
ncbi:ABC transporter permease [Aestuariimicrobium ganziense]|uniref:ABC transporter permease n=1 Tax=Aestuariimicrobium ganziense TaxID=2773677 RepID=UPI0019412178|nr:ABC transporter permease subunit [Aestuariimicrobium ganziense]